MSDEEELFVRRSGRSETLECALVWRGLPNGVETPLSLSRFTWSEAGKAVLDRIRRIAGATTRPEGKQLPYADLRAAIQARVGGLVLLHDRIIPYGDNAPLFASNASVDEVKKSANRTVSAWCQLTLRPWGEKLGVDTGDIDSLERRAERLELFDLIASPDVSYESAPPDALRSNFHDYADSLLAIVASSLDGVELFPGLGPVHRIIDRHYGNVIAFETWPTSGPRGDDLFSMVAELSVETRPSSRFPFLVVRAMKRIWCREFPAAGQLYGRKRISVRAVLRRPSVAAVTLSVQLSAGVPQDKLDTVVFEAGRASGESLNGDLLDLVKSRGRMPEFFVGVPFRYGYRPAPRIEFGVTLQDQLDLTKIVAQKLAHFGFDQSRLRELSAVSGAPLEFHLQANLHNLITHHFGRVSEEDLPTRIEELFGEPEKKTRGPDRPVRTVELKPMVDANRQRLDKAFGAEAKINLVFVCRREREDQIFRSVVGLLFSDRVNVVRYILPEGTHGTRKTLDGKTRLTRLERAAARKEAWSDLAESIRKEFTSSPVIVQAARQYEDGDDDSVNKDVGRNTLATHAGCSVQYLLPPGNGKAAEYMHRVQAALYDLLFAHAGLGPVPAEIVQATFPSTSRPKSIVGISIVSQAASRAGRPDGAELAVAAKVEVATGRISARLGYLNAETFDVGKFETLSGTLVKVAGAGLTSLGAKRADRSANFLNFVRAVIDDVAVDDPNALIIFESTSAKGLWPWLTDDNISSDVFLQDRASPAPMAWKTLRFVRVREKVAGRIGVEQHRFWDPVTREGSERPGDSEAEIYATALERLAESIPEGNSKARHYLSAHGFGVRNQGARGQSSYRTRDGFVKVGGKTPKRKSKGGKVLFRRGTIAIWDKPSRIPGTLEITVLPSQNGDDEDAIATLVAALRKGYSHTIDGTALPAPLSFKSKILDYMDRYGSAPSTEELEVVSDDTEEPEASEESVDPVIGYAETRRWYEGSEVFNTEDVPEFETNDHFDPPDTQNPQPKKKDEDFPLTFLPRQVLDSPIEKKLPMAAETITSVAVNTDVDGGDPNASSEGAEATLLKAIRFPTAKLPSFVNEEFLGSAIHFVRTDIRRMHEERAWIRAITGFPWPEEKPAVEQMPGIYLEALRYPAFAIAVQHQFFSDDYARGFPKNQIMRQFSDASRRILRDHPISRAEAHLSVMRALHVLENGGDRHMVLVELLSLPGQVAWRSLCSKVTDGLASLEQRSDEIAEIGRYLRSVVEPFVEFGDDEPTIGDVFEDIVIPLALKLPVASIPGHPSDVADSSPVSLPNATNAEEEVGNFGESTTGHENAVIEDTIDALGQAWVGHSVEIRLLAEEAVTLGPNDTIVKRLGTLLLALENLQVRALRLTPRLVESSSLIAALAKLITNIASALQSHIGESLDSSEIASAASRISNEVEPSAFAAGEDLHKQALSQYELSEGVAQEIATLEKTLPMKLARDRTAPLVDSREQLLRKSLLFAKNSVEALLVGSTAEIVEDRLVGTLPAIGQTSVVAPEQALPEIMEAANIEEIVDVPLDDGVFLEEELAPPPIEQKIEAKPEVPEPVEDPLRNDVIKCLDHLFIAGEFGLAFHLLSAASAAMPNTDFAYSTAELRLASASGRATSLSGQDLQSLADARSEALAIAQGLTDLTDDRSVARCVTLLAGAIPPALFRSDDMSSVSLVNNIGGKGPTAHYFQLVSAVEENRKRGFPVTAANLAAVEAHSREGDFVKEAIDAIKASVEGFRSSRFRFQLGEKVKYAITQPDGLLGNLLGTIDGSTYDVVRAVGQELKNRDVIVNYLALISSEIGTGQEIDGVARERIIGLLSQVGQQCMDLSDSIEGFNALRRSAGRLDTIKRLRDLALVGTENVLSHCRVRSGSDLIDAANSHAASILLSLRDTLRGKPGIERDPIPLAVALHAPLLWLPKLTWTGGWTPSPYDPDQILQEIMSAPVPLVGQVRSASVERAFEERRAEDAFVPAHMLLNIARWFGVNQAKIDEMRAKLDADKDVKKGQVKTRLKLVERMIDRMRRMAVGSLEQSARLKETLASINPESLPVELPPNFLPESVLGDRVEDFNSAFSRIRDVELEAKREFDKVTAEFAGKINMLDKDGKLDPETAKQLRNLLDGLEFTTLADWINMLQTGEVRKPQLPSGRINRRLEQFKTVLPSLSSVDLLQVARAVESGKSIGPIDYSHLDDYRREEGARIIRMFIELKRAVKKPEAALQVQAKLTEAVSNLFYEVSGAIVDPVLTRLRQGIYACDVKVALPPTDPTSLVLPEFGSLTQGAWRVCVVTPTIAQSDLLNLGEGAGSRGVIVYVLGVLNAERREQLRVELSKRRRAMLVIDEALIAVTIADPEDRRRAVIEIAQGYSGADPYKDHGKSAVPAEMFKGRAVERGEIVKPFGSYVVYGGRRLGKTALLQQISATSPANAIFAYVDLDMVTDASDAFERIVRKMGDEVVKSSVRTGSEFAAAILAWLEADERRRIVLLLDEADNFVRQETESNFRCIQTMLQLMAETTNRFKFVLAGLHNVSRSLRTENSPLVQISNNPIQIGPLLNRDVDDAEFLVRGPLAAMGFEFDNREDVWRILSFTNYYPVLIQVFCQELLRLIHTQVVQTNKLPSSISTALVERALSSSDVRGKLFQTFEKTINSIEGRYELITYILAARELMERESGMAAEGATAAEVAELAMVYWPAAFQKGSDPADLEYLLEEMEGFGIARRTPSGKFALRSRSLLELMAASEDELNRKLESFKNERAPPKPFDPKNIRKPLSSMAGRKDGEIRMSPLTDGQEADLFSPLHSSGISAVFGTACAGIRYVESALMDARRAKDGSLHIDVRTFENKKEMLDEAKRSPKGSSKRVLVVSSGSPWNADWVIEAERLGRRRHGELRVIFVGNSKHARAWAGDDAVGKRALPQIKIVKLRPWSRSFLGTRVDAIQLPGDLVDRIYAKTGGWNEVVGPLMTRIAEKPGDHAVLLAASATSAISSPTILADMGIPDDLLGFFKELAAFADGSTITTADFQYLCTSDGRKISPRIVGAYSDLMGIISFPPNQGAGHGHRKVDLNPLALAVLLRPE